MQDTHDMNKCPVKYIVQVQACWGLENTVVVIVRVNNIVRCRIWEVISSIIDSHKIVRSGLAHIGWTTINICVFFFSSLYSLFSVYATHTNTFIYLSCFYINTSERSEVIPLT